MCTLSGLGAPRTNASLGDRWIRRGFSVVRIDAPPNRESTRRRRPGWEKIKSDWVVFGSVLGWPEGEANEGEELIPRNRVRQPYNSLDGSPSSKLGRRSHCSRSSKISSLNTSGGTVSLVEFLNLMGLVDNPQLRSDAGK